MFELGDDRYEAYLNGEFPRGLGIQVYRRLNGITQRELAARLYVSPTSISGWETGKHAVSPEMLERIAEQLGVATAKIKAPPKEDVEKASHLAIHDGHHVRREVLRVKHDEKEHYPEAWQDPLWADARKTETPPIKEGKLDQGPLVTWGPDGLFTSYTTTLNQLQLNRLPTLHDSLLLVDEDRITPARMLRCVRFHVRLAADRCWQLILLKSLYTVPMSYQDYLDMEKDSGPFTGYLDDKLELLQGLEYDFHLEEGVLQALTPIGRAWVRSHPESLRGSYHWGEERSIELRSSDMKVLSKISSQCERVFSYMSSCATLDAFRMDLQLQDACLYNVEGIIKNLFEFLSAKCRSTFVESCLNTLCEFKSLVGCEDAEVRCERLWVVVRDSLPSIYATVRKICKDMRRSV